MDRIFAARRGVSVIAITDDECHALVGLRKGTEHDTGRHDQRQINRRIISSSPTRCYASMGAVLVENPETSE